MKINIKKRKCKKLMALGAAVAMLFSSGSLLGAEAGFAEKQETEEFFVSYEEIMNEYYHARDELRQLQPDFGSRSVENSMDDLVIERNQALENSGYQVYEVNSENLGFIENELCTDLGAIGLNDGGNYLVLIENGMPGRSEIAPPGNYSYAYGGVTYTMRKIIVTAADAEASSGYAQASTVNVLKSSSSDIIKNVLNTAVYAYINSYSQLLGTVASICGINFGDFGSAQESTLNLNAGSNWTRLYTQVYSSYDNAWRYGSCVEYVYCSTFMSGHYYNAKTNQMTPVPANASTATLKSSKYEDREWQNTQAAIAFKFGSVCTHDSTGSVQYKYDGKVKITHYENF